VPTKMTRPRPSLSLKSQATGTQATMRLGLHHSSDVTFGGPRSQITKFKAHQIKKNMAFLAEIAKCNEFSHYTGCSSGFHDDIVENICS